MPARDGMGQLEKHLFRQGHSDPCFLDMQQLTLGFLVVLAFASLSPADQIDVSLGETGGKLMLRRGDLLVIRLPSNRTTGYCWSVESSKHDVLKQEADVIYEKAGCGMVIAGAGGRETWKFHAIFAGLTTLRFYYSRPWERGVPPLRVVTWTVEVR